MGPWVCGAIDGAPCESPMTELGRCCVCRFGASDSGPRRGATQSGRVLDGGCPFAPSCPHVRPRTSLPGHSFRGLPPPFDAAAVGLVHPLRECVSGGVGGAAAPELFDPGTDGPPCRWLYAVVVGAGGVVLPLRLGHRLGVHSSIDSIGDSRGRRGAGRFEPHCRALKLSPRS